MSETPTLLKVTQKKLPASQLGLEIEIPGTRSQQAYETVVKNLMKTAQIPGFRRGKIPRQVILQRFGSNHLKAATLEDLVQNSLKEAIEQEKIHVLGNLELQSSFEELIDQFQPGTDLSFSASADILPEVTLSQYSDFEVKVVESVYDASRIDSTLEQQQSAHATLVPVDDRTAQVGDVVMVDFVSTFCNDSQDETADSPEESEIKDFQVELSETAFLPGFVQGVTGMSIDETKEFKVDFPKDYFEKTIAGRKATFKVTLNDIKAKEMPALTDDFAQEISEFETLEALKTFLEGQYQKEAQDETENRTKKALVDELIEGLEVELPKSMIDQEVNVLLNEMAVRFQSQGININQILTKESLPGFQEQLRSDAIARLKRTLALAEIAKKEGLEVEEEALEAKFVETLKGVDESKIDRDRLKEVLAEELLEEKAFDWLKARCKITLVEASDVNADETPKMKPEDKAEAPKTAKAKPTANKPVADQDISDKSNREIQAEATNKPGKKSHQKPKTAEKNDERASK